MVHSVIDIKDKIKVYVDMDNVLCDFQTAYDKAIEKTPTIKFPQSQYGFFQKLRPLPDAIKSMHLLGNSGIFDVYILTAPSESNPLSYTEKRVWVEENLGIDWVSKLIISPNKSLFIGGVLIDDNVEGKGQENFNGYLIHFGSKHFPDWNAIMENIVSSNRWEPKFKSLRNLVNKTSQMVNERTNRKQI